ncbi:MAG: RHS repeat-associated core domain-containing protein, partial [Cyanothece sp. SIO2G6]|nr:RHS repeat-associated core domain-containing protein [Cyanothece sp. SIO2G6]
DEEERIIQYTYDDVGNRLTQDGSVEGLTRYTYDENDRLVSETTGEEVIQYTYDDNGNLIRKNVEGSLEQTNYVWNHQDLLIGINATDASGQTKTIQYGYDAEGIRVSSTVDGVETRYLIDSNRPYAQVIEEYIGEGESRQTQVSYTYGLDLVSQDRGSDDLFYHEDAHSGVRQLTDESGNITDVYDYDAYGNLIASATTSDNDYLYRGEQFDSDANLQYLRARYYDPSTGRFSSVDPFEGHLDQPISRHRYLYANANPISFLDPSGEVSMADISLTRVFERVLHTISTTAGRIGGAVGGRTILKAQNLDNIFRAVGIAVSVAGAYLASRGTGNTWRGSLALTKVPTYGAPNLPTIAAGSALLQSSRGEEVRVGVLGASYSLAELINISLPRQSNLQLNLVGPDVATAMQTRGASSRGSFLGPFVLSTLRFTFPIILPDDTWVTKDEKDGVIMLGFTAGTANGTTRTVGEGSVYDGLNFDVLEIGITTGVSVPRLLD